MPRHYPDGLDEHGAPLEETPATVPADAIPARDTVAGLTGDQIDEGLRALELPVGGKVEDRRARLAAALDPSTPADTDTTTADGDAGATE